MYCLRQRYRINNYIKGDKMRQSHKFLATIDSSFYRRYLQQMLMIVGFILFSLVSGPVSANPFAKNIPASAPNACPANHRMYYIGRSNPAYTPKETRGLVWTSGNQKQDKFTFDEGATNKIFFMQFTGIDLNNSQTNNQNNGNTPPFFGGITDATSNAINLVHNSPAIRTTNNTVRLSSNWPMSKIGFKIQDLDASRNTGTSLAYIEQARALNGGKLSLAYTPPALPFHVISNGNTTVTGIAGRNCSLNECNIDAAWGYTPADTEVVLEHDNTKTSVNSPHAVGYSDFYYCLAPPKIVLQKALTGTRVQTTDQFSLEVTGDNTVPTNNFTTTGSGSTIDNNNAATAVAVAPNTTYTIVESIIGGGDIRNYDATYSCSNATTQSATDLSSASGSTVYNSSNNTRSFTLSNLNYGDEITCTITNTPTAYTFSGIVFNDNGGIENNSTNLDTNTKYDISSTFTGNNNYFNGKFEREIEQGIYASGLQVRLTDCGADDGGTNIAGTTAKNVSDAPATLGQFKFTVPASALAGKSRVCLVQTEPSAWKDSGFSVDTTSNSREVTLVNGTLDYKTENDGSRNLDFGEVVKSQSALVLIKSQYLHACNDTLDFMNSAINQPTSNPMVGFSDQPPQTSVEPGNCIAYRIDAYNRGHVDIRDVQITDELQQTPVKSVFHLPYPKGSSSSVYDNTGSLPMGTIVSKIFNLDKPTGTSATKATLYFNTKYGTTVDP